MELGDSPFGGTRIPWNFMSLHVPWNFRSFMEFHGTSQLGMGFHGILKFHRIPWNFSTGYSDSMDFGYVAKFHGTFKIPLNSMELCSRCGDSMEFHGIWCWHQVPWNFQSSMEFRGTSLLSWKVPWNSMELLASSMEFHGIPWNCEIFILINFMIGEVYFTVCCMISCYYISDNPLVVEILRYFNSKATFWCPSFCSNGDIPFKMAACFIHFILCFYSAFQSLGQP